MKDIRVEVIPEGVSQPTGARVGAHVAGSTAVTALLTVHCNVMPWQRQAPMTPRRKASLS
jgi:hypothetical protein